MRIYLKELRIKNKLSQMQTAEKLYISESYYNLIENGERQQKMDINLIQKLSDVFNVPITYIIAEETKLHTC